MARSSETFFGPDNRVVTKGQDIPDDDAIIAGREHLFGQKRKRRRGAQTQSEPAAPIEVPASPTLDGPGAGTVLDSGRVDVTGTAPAGSAVALYDGDTLLTTATADLGGRWVATVTFANGDHDIYATATVAGVMSEPSDRHEFAVGASSKAAAPAEPESEPAEPDAPTIEGPAADAALDSGSVDVTGTAPAGSAVALYDGDTLLNTVSAGLDGRWVSTVTFVPGDHAVYATATVGDLTGEASETTHFTVAGTPGPAVAAAAAEPTGPGGAYEAVQAAGGTAEAKPVDGSGDDVLGDGPDVAVPPATGDAADITGDGTYAAASDGTPPADPNATATS